jgi:hypothetical protein
MASEDEINEQKKLLAAHRRTLAILLEQRAKHTSASVPTAIEHGIIEAREYINEIGERLRRWGVEVESHDQPSPTVVQQTENRPSHTATVIVAVIGGIAIIIGAVVAGLFGIIQARTQLEIPLYATQIAEARLTATADAKLLAANSSPAPASTTPTSLPNPTSTVVPTSPSAAPTETPSQVSKDWKDLIRIDDFAPLQCPILRVMPDHIMPNEDPATARDQLAQAGKQGEFLKWPAGPVQTLVLNGVHPQIFQLTNIATGKEWIRIDPTVHVSVLTITKNVPDHVNIIWLGQCGATKEIQTFPDVALQSDFNKYDASTTLKDVGAFGIQPGEFELFNFRFKCRAPGIYQIRFEIRYGYSGQQGSITFDNASEFMCPKSFSYWLGEEALFHGKYTWNGTTYESAP